MRVGVVGINHKMAGLRLREILAKVCEKRFGAKRIITHNRHEFILLSTCNRTEIYFCSDDLTASHSYILGIIRQEVREDFDQKMYSYFGLDCFLHLSRVTAGLDSAIVGETEIQGQVKAAYESTKTHVTLPQELHFMFQKALKNGKEVRQKIPQGRGIPDIEHAILHLGEQHLEDPVSSRVLFVGASAINQKILSFLKYKGISDITLCNRTDEKTLKICERLQIKSLLWKDFYQWHKYDWLVFGTKSPEHLLSLEDLVVADTPKFVIDLSVPRNVDPQIDQDPRMVVHNIDQIHRYLTTRKQTLQHQILDAESLITQAVSLQASLFAEKTEHFREMLEV